MAGAAVRTAVVRTAVVALVAVALGVVGGPPVGGQAADVVVAADGAELVAGWNDPTTDVLRLSADVTLTCADEATRTAPADDLVVEGAGHTITDTCTNLADPTLFTSAPVDLFDLEVIGAPRDAGEVIWGPPTAVGIIRSRIEGHTSGAAQLWLGPGSRIVDSTVDAPAGGYGLSVTDFATAIGTITIERSVFTGVGRGVDHDSGTDLVVRDSTFRMGDWAVYGFDVTVERSSLQGGNRALFVKGDTVVRDSTLVVGAAGSDPSGAALVAVGVAEVTVERSTLLTASDGHPAVRLENDAAASLRASAVVGPAVDPACVGAVASLGHDVVTDDSCGSGADDEVTDPQLEPFDPDTGVAAPRAGSPVLDLVPAASCGGGTDQLGTTRPQGTACDAGAVEVAVAVPPTTTTVVVGGPGPPVPARPASPVVGPARFTG